MINAHFFPLKGDTYLLEQVYKLVLHISASSVTGGGSLQNRYCGGYLNEGGNIIAIAASVPIRDCTLPFEATFRTDATVDDPATGIANNNRGVCIDYHLEPCGSTVLP